MITAIRTILKKNPNIVVFVASAALLYGLVVVIVDKKLEDLEGRLMVQASDQRSLLVTIAETTARNGADSTTEAIVRDCSVEERGRFDVQLAKLNDGLSARELDELSRLFDRCGNFFAQRKSVMVARLSREIDVYALFVDQLKTVSSKSVVDSYKVSTWRSLAEAEKRQSDSFTRLAVLQRDIITRLTEGKSPASSEVKDILVKVKEEQQALSVAHTQASDIRKSLLSL